MKNIAIQLLSLVCFVACPVFAEELEWVKKSNTYSQQVMRVQAEFNPEEASFYGLTEFGNDKQSRRRENFEP